MIPQILHQIWLGVSPPPLALMATFRKNHPDWSYRLWRDNNLPPLQNQSQFQWCKRMSKRADILRYELLYHYGGIYMDADFLSLRSMEDLRDMEFFAGIEKSFKNGRILMANGAIGIEPQHPLMRNLIHKISLLSQKQCEAHSATHTTGPIVFTQAWYEYPCGTPLPTHYFYPISQTEHHLAGGKLPPDFPQAYAKSYALHLWAGDMGYEGYQ